MFYVLSNNCYLYHFNLTLKFVSAVDKNYFLFFIRIILSGIVFPSLSPEYNVLLISNLSSLCLDNISPYHVFISRLCSLCKIALLLT